MKNSPNNGRTFLHPEGTYSKRLLRDPVFLLAIQPVFFVQQIDGHFTGAFSILTPYAQQTLVSRMLDDVIAIYCPPENSGPDYFFRTHKALRSWQMIEGDATEAAIPDIVTALEKMGYLQVYR